MNAIHAVSDSPRFYGGMTISAIPDLARPIMVYGLTSTFRDGWRPFVTNMKTARLAAREVKLAGTGLDMVLDTRTQAMADLFQDFQRGSVFERALDNASARFGMVSLMAPWNAAHKQMNGVMVMSNVLRAARAVAEGKATPKQIERLAASGINDQMARRISKEFGAGGEIRDGVYLPNTEDWTDAGARNALRAAIVRDVDRIIVTPGVERPLWTSQTWGRLMGQFKAFAFASTQRTLMAGLQQRDAAFVSGLFATLALGALSFWLKAFVAGEERFAQAQNASAAIWATEAVDNSGILGILSDVNNIAEKATRGRVGLSYFTGHQASRYQSRSAVGSLLGPTYDLAASAFQISGATSSGEWTAGDTRAVRKMLPFQNLFWLRQTLNEIERRVNATLGVKQRAAGAR